MEINLVLLAPNGMMVGWQYFKSEKGFDFKEVNLFILFFQIQFRWA